MKEKKITMSDKIEKNDNNLIKIRDVNFEMRPPYIDAKWDGEPTFENAIKIELAAGNETRYEFVKKPNYDISEFQSGLVKFTKINGTNDKDNREIFINTSSIISIEEITIVSRNYLITKPTKGPNFGTVSLSYPPNTTSVKFSKDI